MPRLIQDNIMKIFLAVFVALFVMSLSMPSHAEGPLRTKIKERIAEKIQSAPAPEATASVADKITKPGDYYYSITHQGLVRMYRVHVPRRAAASKAAPLIFAFHGGGGDMDYMARDELYGLISQSDKEGFVLIFPNGYSKLTSGKFATWNAGACCGDARDKNIDDVGFVKTIVQNISGQMNIDRNRIFATGMSNGGMMSYRLACELPDIFTAVASVAGTDGTLQCHPAHPISVLHIHAQNDDHVLFNGGVGKGRFKDESKVMDFVSVPDTIARWVKRDQCDSTHQRVLAVEGAYCDVYASCQEGVAVKLCVTDAGGHSWPGGHKPRGDERPSTAISANDQIWAFFSGQR